jgi:hypothetical protein
VVKRRTLAGPNRQPARTAPIPSPWPGIVAMTGWRPRSTARPRRALAWLVTAALLLAFASPASAADSYTKKRVESIVSSVVTSANPDAAYLALTPDERAAFDQYMTAGTVEVSAGKVEQVASGQGLDSGAASIVDPGGGGGSSCWQITKTVTFKNYYGTILWQWKQHGEWCGNGTKITKTIARSWWPLVYASYWQANASFNNWQSGGYNYTYWRSFAQAEFKWCPPLAGCSDYHYPWIDITMRPNGTVDGALGS